MKRICVLCRRIPIAIIMSIIAAPLFASPPVELNPQTLNGSLIGKHCEYYEDKEKKLTINDIAANGKSLVFIPVTTDSFGLGYSTSACWVRFTVHNPTDKPVTWFLESDTPGNTVYDLYIPDKDKKFIVKKGRVEIPAPQREIDTITPIYSITQAPGLATYYMKYEGDAGISIPLRVWAQKPMVDSIIMKWGFIYLFYGGIIIMILYNLFIFISVRESVYLFYVLKIACFLLLYQTMDGVGQNYVYGGNKYIIDHAFPTALPLMAIMIILFTRPYLESRLNTPRLDRVMIILGIISFVMLFLQFVMPISTFVLLLLLILLIQMTFLFFIVLPVYLKKHSRPGLYFFVAYMVYIVGSFLRVFASGGIIANNFVTLNGPQLGCLAMVIIFSLGLADKINTMKNELADLNKNLEQKVQDRTAELNAAMEELEAMNQNLKATMEELEATNEQLVSTRDALWGEMQLAKKIQTVLLPPDPKISGYSIAAYMQPADEVGGDYYDIINVGGRDWIVIGDVSGHGVPAGLVMMMVQTAIQTALVQNSGLAPNELLAIINTTITKNIRLLGENKYMTITVFAYVENGTFHFSGLHQDILMYRQKTNGVESIETNGMWLGIIDDVSEVMTTNRLSMESGDTMLLYTDGITEARDSMDNLFSEERLIGILLRQGRRPVEEIRESILEDMKGCTCNDDITMVLIKRN